MDPSKTTLREQLARPVCIRRDMSAASASEVVFNVRDLVVDGEDPFNEDQKAPEDSALEFYMLQHAMAEIRQRVTHEDTQLGEYGALFELYHERVNLAAARMFSYLLLICAREARPG